MSLARSVVSSVSRTVAKPVNEAGGSGGAGLSPDAITGLQRWGKPDTLLLSDGDLIASYADSSGNGNTMTATTTLRPTYKANIQNRLPVVRWNGSSNFMRCSALASVFSGNDKPFTFFCVAKFTPDQTHQCFFIAADDAGGSDTPTHDFFFRNESWSLWADRRDDSATIKRAAGWTPDSNWHTFILRFDGSVQTIFVDGIARGTIANDANVGTMTVGSYVIGAHNRNGLTEAYFNGDWGDDGLYNVAITDSQVAGLHAWLKQKWNTSTPAAEPWTPLRLANIFSWHREDSLATTTNDATPAAWYTKAPFGTTSPDLSSGTKPPYKTSGINGRAALLFNGTTHYLYGSSVFSSLVGGTSVPFTVFGVFQATNTTGAQTLFFAWDSASVNSLHRLRLEASAAGYRFDRRTSAGSLVNTTAGTPDTSVRSFVAIYDGTNQTLYVDGVKIIDAVPLSAPTLVINNFGIAQVRTNGGEFFGGYYAELGTVSRAIGTSEVTQLNSYLQRWL